MLLATFQKALQKTCSFILLAGGRINAAVTGPHKNERNNGLEVLCQYHIKAPRPVAIQVKFVIK